MRQDFDSLLVSYMRIITIALLFFTFLAGNAHAQQDAPVQQSDDTSISGGNPNRLPFLDSVALAMQQRDQFVSDSLATIYVRPGNPLRRNLLVDTLLKMNLYKGSNNFLDIPHESKNLLKEGHARKTRDQWVIVTIIGLLLYTGLLNRVMSKDVESVWQSFYSKRVLSAAGKEDSIINAWTFIALFLLFGLIFGLFLYQLAQYKGVYYSINGVRLFVSFSLIILAALAIKFLIVKFLGFVFNINKLVTEYLSTLYLTYFNIGFVFLPVTVCFCLLAAELINYVLWIALVLAIVIFIWQYLRSSVEIVSNILFHKFYLIVYLCALEICPVLILIKALNI
ncbi:MAG: DUF4271 domain-containing protein [Bacteroidetes bacterium]|nr:DUF4271 domain-containing protein [Bacteroidota bacterium]